MVSFFFWFSPPPWEIIQFGYYFSNGLKPPTSRHRPFFLPKKICTNFSFPTWHGQGWVLRKSFRPQRSLANGWGIWHPGLWAMDANLWDMQMRVKDFKQRDGRVQRDIWKWESSMQQRNSFQDFIFGIQLFTIVLIIIWELATFFLQQIIQKKHA